jgi:phosphoglycerate dehydrogenase-like enzyme
MTVWGLRRRSVDKDQEGPAERVLVLDELPELLGASDFVVLAASLNPSSRRLLVSAQFQAMKLGAFLVSVSRGALIDEAALAFCLASGRLGGRYSTSPRALGRRGSLDHSTHVGRDQ